MCSDENLVFRLAPSESNEGFPNRCTAFRSLVISRATQFRIVITERLYMLPECRQEFNLATAILSLSATSVNSQH